MQKQKGIASIIFVIVIIAFLVVGGGFSAYKYYTTIKEKFQPETQEQEQGQESNNQQQNTQNLNQQQADDQRTNSVKPANETIEVKKENAIEIDPQAIEEKGQICSKKLESGYNDGLCYLELALMTDKKEICEAIDSGDLKSGDYKNFCLAILQKNITLCQYADGQSGIKGLSIICSAIIKKDYGMCNNNELKESMGIEFVNEICPLWINRYIVIADKKFFDPVAYCQRYEIKEQCYQESINMIIDFAKPSSYDQSICNLLDNSSYSLNDGLHSLTYRDICYSNVAMKKNDINICNMIGNSYTRGLCATVIKK